MKVTAVLLLGPCELVQTDAYGSLNETYTHLW